MKKLFILFLTTFIYLNAQAPQNFIPPTIPKEPITEKAFKKAIGIVSEAEGYRVAKTILQLPKNRINSAKFFEGFQKAKNGKEISYSQDVVVKAQQTSYFYYAQKEQAKDAENKKHIDFFNNSKDKRTLDSGIKYKYIKKSTGEQVKIGDKVKINYKGMLKTGKKFDDTYERKQPIELTLEKGQIIEGWLKLIPQLKVGEIVQAFIPASLAYGDVATGPIPAKSDLFFMIEVISTQTPPKKPVEDKK